ncbi:dihydrofolate reductase family protein [Nocardia sp. GCM10030253]|uniref:dihydrofolate reductase family protein n=1 Tax=Nocardia sp. GCM10030253 TaxID=3273404 RepID=UPI0036454D77
MGKIIESTNVSLDGLMDNMQDWHFEYFQEGAMEFAGAQLKSADALLMGRQTYEGFAQAWPQRTGDWFSDKFNAMKKYVVSSTLTDPTWNNTTVLGSDVPAEIARVKAETEGDILMYGHGPVARLLLEHGLLDEVRLWIHPIFAGRADPEHLIYRDTTKTPMRLLDTRILDTGIIIATYGPETPAA